MRGTPRIGMIAPRICTGLDGHESIISIGIGKNTTVAAEVRVERRIVLIAIVRVPSRCVGLPDFDQGIGNCPPILIDQAPRNDNALALRITGMLAREIGILRGNNAVAVHRRLQVTNGIRHRQQWLTRHAQAGAAVVIEAIWRINRFIFQCRSMHNLNIHISDHASTTSRPAPACPFPAIRTQTCSQPRSCRRENRMSPTVRTGLPGIHR